MGKNRSDGAKRFKVLKPTFQEADNVFSCIQNLDKADLLLLRSVLQDVKDQDPAQGFGVV